jgi:hypothetical protein
MFRSVVAVAFIGLNDSLGAAPYSGAASEMAYMLGRSRKLITLEAGL